MQFTNAAQFSAFSKVDKFALRSCGGNVDRFPENFRPFDQWRTLREILGGEIFNMYAFVSKYEFKL